jgi:hypothetical protein
MILSVSQIETIAEGLRPIAEVLLETFPWICPNDPNEFSCHRRDLGFHIFLTLSCHIEVARIGKEGTIRFFTTHPNNRIVFALNDPADAVGIVSALLPFWKQDSSFREPCFPTYVRDRPFFVSGYPWINQAESFLTSPSGISFLCQGLGSEPMWFEMNQTFSNLRNDGIIRKSDLPRLTITEVLES